MMRLITLDVYSSIFNITELNNIFELNTNTSDEFYFEELNDDFEEILTISDMTPYHLQHEKKDRVLLKHIRNYDYKNQALMVIL